MKSKILCSERTRAHANARIHNQIFTHNVYILHSSLIVPTHTTFLARMFFNIRTNSSSKSTSQVSLAFGGESPRRVLKSFSEHDA